MFCKTTSHALVAFLLVFLVDNATAGPALSLTLSGARHIKDVDDFAVVAVISNTGDVLEETFTIPSESGAPGFVGAHAKYRFKMATNFIDLEPGANISVTHDFAMGYDFTEGGDYEVDASNLFHYQDEAGEPRPICATVSIAHSAKLGGSLHSAKRPGRGGLKKRVTFTGCSTARKTIINTALRVANNYLALAVTYLTRQTRSTTRYTTWFVLGHFKRTQTSDPRKYKYDCSTCTEDYHAYTYANQFAVFYVCKNFWTSPSAGSDSQARTIIHEATHFTRNGNTDEYAYGQTACKALDKSTLSKAIHNADSHDYFAENVPYFFPSTLKTLVVRPLDINV